MARTPLLRGLRALFRDYRAAESQGMPLEAFRERRVSRRAFLASGAATGAGLALPAFVRASARRTLPRVAVVGGGIAGLACALTLKDYGIPATVYEASGRVGGRIFSRTSGWADGQVTEWGGELIDSGHRTMLGLAKRFALPVDDLLRAQTAKSEDTYYFFQRHYPKAQADADFRRVYDAAKADLKAAGYPTTWDASTAAGRALDRMTVHDWIATRVPGGHASSLGRLLDVAYIIEFGADSREQSALNLLYLLAYQPRATELAVFGESDEAYHIRGGNERLPRAIADALGPDAVLDGHRLERIRAMPGGGYRLSFANRPEVDADWVVLAVPFAVLRDVDTAGAGFDDRKRRAIEQLGRGVNGKTQLQFRSRLWNTSGAWPGISNGSSYSDTGYQAGWDATRAQAGPSGILVFYSGGSVAASMRSKTPFSTEASALAKADAVDALHRAEPVFPGLSAAWNGRATQSLPHLNPLFKGSYSFYRPGQYAEFGGYERARQGGVLFCGEHTTQDYQGFMEGGASEGVRAGLELADLLD